MILTAALTAALILAAVIARWQCATWWHPWPIYFLVWSVICGVLALRPLELTVLSAKAVGLLAAGLTAVFLGFCYSPRQSRLRVVTVRLPSLARLTAAASGFLTLTLIGAVAVRNSIEQAAGGQQFQSLSASQIRYLTVYGDARRIGIGAVLFSLAPVVAGFGIAIARQRFYGWVFVVAAVGLTTLTPARTFTVTTALIGGLFWTYLRGPEDGAARSARIRPKQIAAVVAGVLACAAYFQYQGDQLGKSSAFSNLNQRAHLPTLLIPVTVYLVGSGPSLAEATLDHVNPASDEPLRSIWVLPRIASLIGAGTQVPDTVAEFVNIPFPFNTYTWVGDAWFDFGVIGVLLIGFAMGVTGKVVDHLARTRRSLATSWAAAVTVTMVLWSVIELRFFWLETPLYIVSGVIVFALCEPRPRPAPALLARGERA